MLVALFFVCKGTGAHKMGRQVSCYSCSKGYMEVEHLSLDREGTTNDIILRIWNRYTLNLGVIYVDSFFLSSSSLSLPLFSFLFLPDWYSSTASLRNICSSQFFCIYYMARNDECKNLIQSPSPPPPQAVLDSFLWTYTINSLFGLNWWLLLP